MKTLFYSLIALCLGSAASLAQDDFITEPLLIERGSGEPVAFQVEIADEQEEIQNGLMFRESLAPDRGMLFDFGLEREANMFMKNVPIALDMLFLDSEGTVLAMAEWAEPQSLRIINPRIDVRGVLEIPGGRIEELGIAIGDRIVHPLFGGTLPAGDTPIDE